VSRKQASYTLLSGAKELGVNYLTKWYVIALSLIRKLRFNKGFQEMRNYFRILLNVFVWIILFLNIITK